MLLQAEALKYQNRLDGVLIEVRHGEIVGLQVCSAWSKRNARALFGAELLNGGTTEGSLLPCVVPMTPSMRDGFPLRGPADGIIPERENLTLAATALTQWGIVSRKRQGELVDRFMQRLGIKATGAEQKIHELSGGNQQKVLLARWLCKNTKLLLDEPTRGIDVGRDPAAHRRTGAAGSGFS